MPNQFFSPEGDLENYFVTEYWLIDRYVGDTLWNWGNNAAGKLGTNNILARTTPVTTFAGGTDWVQIKYSNFYSMGIKTDGTLWLWGSNTDGQLGTNDLINRSTPVQTFSGGTNWKQISSGYRHTVGIRRDGSAWAWGNNGYGRLGDGTTTQRRTPVPVFGATRDWKQVSCGYNCTIGLKTDGSLWGWGGNGGGTLGLGGAGGVFTTPVQITPTYDWKQVSVGVYHSAAIKTDGSLWVWGDNFFGELGIGDTSSIDRFTPVTTILGGNDWKQVECGYYFTTAIKTNGTLYAWGANNNGECGNGNVGTISIPTQVFGSATNWKQVSPGYRSCYAIKTDGSLWCWGGNSYGELGINNTAVRLTPVTTFLGNTNWKQVSAGRSHVGAITSGTNPSDFIS